MILIAMAGLPATGKSTIAGRLADVLDAPLFDKDRVRAALFGPRAVDYSRAQDDLVVGMLHSAVEYVAREGRHGFAILDGRTHSRRAQVEELRAFADRIAVDLSIVECRCSRATARERLARDESAGLHPAANRDAELHARLEAEAEEIALPKLVLDTDACTIEEAVLRVLAFVRVA